MRRATSNWSRSIISTMSGVMTLRTTTSSFASNYAAFWRLRRSRLLALQSIKIHAEIQTAIEKLSMFQRAKLHTLVSGKIYGLMQRHESSDAKTDIRNSILSADDFLLRDLHIGVDLTLSSARGRRVILAVHGSEKCHQGRTRLQRSDPSPWQTGMPLASGKSPPSLPYAPCHEHSRRDA